MNINDEKINKIINEIHILKNEIPCKLNTNEDEIIKKASSYDECFFELNGLKKALENQKKLLINKEKYFKDEFENDCKEAKEEIKKLTNYEIEILTTTWENLFFLAEESLRKINELIKNGKINNNLNLGKTNFSLNSLSQDELNYIGHYNTFILCISKLIEPKKINKQSKTSIFYYFPELMISDEFKTIENNFYYFDYYNFIAPTRDKFIAHFDLVSTRFIKTYKCGFEGFFLFEWDILRKAICNLDEIKEQQWIEQLQLDAEKIKNLQTKKDSN